MRLPFFYVYPQLMATELLGLNREKEDSLLVPVEFDAVKRPVAEFHDLEAEES